MLGRILALVAGVAGVAAGSQAPNFTNNFEQNLAGRIDELRTIVMQVQTVREQAGLTREMAQAACDAAPDASLRNDCLTIDETITRFDTLVALKEELEAVPSWQRPISLIQSAASDPVIREIAENTMEEFKPAIPATAEGAGYGAAGGGVLWGVLRAIFGLIAMPFRRNY